MKKIQIQKHLTKTHQHWYGTNLDSQMFFPETWYSIDKKILNKYFEIGRNGGSYSLNFSSENLDTILFLLNLNNNDIEFVIEDDSKIIPKKYVIDKDKYFNMKVSNKIDSFTEYLIPYIS